MKRLIIFAFLCSISAHAVVNAFTKGSKITNASLKTQAKPVKLNIKNKKDEVLFWAGQFVDHANYVSRMVNNKKDKEYGLVLARQFANIKNEIEVSKTLHKDILSYYKRLLKRLNHYLKVAKHDVVVQAGSVTFKPLITHMQEELRYHWRNLKRGKRSMHNEQKFWDRHDKEVVDFESMIPKVSSSEKKIINELLKLGLKQHEEREDRYAESKGVRLLKK